MNGEIQVVENVPQAFAALVVEDAPRSIALSGGGTAARVLRAARRCRRSTGARCRCSSATNAGCRSTTPTPTRAWRGRCLLDQVKPRAIHSLRNAGDTIDDAASRTTRSSASSARSTSCTSASAPTGTPRRCFPARPRSTSASASWCRTPVTPTHPHDRLTFTYPGDRAVRARGVHGRGRRQARRVRPRPRRRRPPRGARDRATGDLAGRPPRPWARQSRSRHERAPSRLRVVAAESWIRGGRSRSSLRPRLRDMSGTVDPTTLVDAPFGELMAEAARLRDSAHGARLTFSPKVFIPLTMLCRDRCGYCTFAKPPAHLEAPYLSLDEVLAIARRGAALGCHEALFTLGEAPEDRYPRRGRLARRARLRLDRRLPRRRLRGGARGDRPAPPRQRRRALAGGARAAAGGEPVAGNDDRDARGPPRRAGRPALRRARQDARAPARHARGGGPRRDPVHHRHPRRHRRDARRAHRRAARDRATRTRATGTCRR